MTDRPQTTVFDPLDVPGVIGTRYPGTLAESSKSRHKRRLGDHGGLRNFGVNLVTLPPGSASALRHHHSQQDEFVYIVRGTPTLITNAGSTTLKPGLCATFPAGNGDGHMLLNGTDSEIVYIEVGDRTPEDQVVYPDDDLIAAFVDGAYTFSHRDGMPY